MLKSVMLLHAVLLILLVTPKSAWALEENIRHYRGVRSLGMGGIWVTSGRYEESLFGNPATQLEDETWKISILNITTEANANIVEDAQKVKGASGSAGSDVLTKIADANLVGRNEHARVAVLPGFYSPRLFGENTSFAFAILSSFQTNIMLRSNGQLEAMAIADVGPNMGIAHRFLDGSLNVGFNLRAIYRAGGDKVLRTTDLLGGSKITVKDIGGQGMGIDGDLGAFYKVPLEIPLVRLSFGASVNNVAASKYDQAFTHVIKSVPAGPPANDRTLNLGTRIDLPNALILSDNFLAFEVRDIPLGASYKSYSFWKMVHMSAETKLTRVFSLRGGFNQMYPGGGVGINLPLLKIDVATYAQELSSNWGNLYDRRYTVRICLDI